MITYELLKDQKFRKEKAKDTIQDLKIDKVPSYILSQIENLIIQAPVENKNLYIYGRIYIKPSLILAEIVLQALKKLKIAFVIKSTALLR